MSDRELLEMAAKAIGRTIKYNMWESSDANDPWDPLEDDGDALRLANQLRINLQFGFEGECSVNAYKHDGSCDAEESGFDQDACTRRAIVRAAAAIGKQMTEPSK